MGHDAFTLVDVVPSGVIDEKEKITCLTYQGDVLFVGTVAGRIHVFRVTSATSSSTGKPEFVHSRLGILDATGGGASGGGSTPSASAGKAAPVSQIDTVPDLSLLVALCDGGLTTWDTDSFKRRPSGGLDAKGALSFAVNLVGPPRYRLCVVTAKRRIRLYEWSTTAAADGKVGGADLASAVSSAGRYAFWKEFELPDTPRALCYYGSRLACGYQREYNVLCADTGQVTDVTGMMARDTRPLVKHLPGDHLLIVTADDVGVIVTATGEPAAVGGGSGGVPGLSAAALQFSHHPLGLAYCYPYVLSVGAPGAGGMAGVGGMGGGPSAGQVEVLAGREGRAEVVQRLAPGPPGCVPVAVADGRVGSSFRSGVDYTEAGAKGRNPVYLATASPTRIARLLPLPVDRQVSDLLKGLAVSPAQDLLANTAPPPLLVGKLERLNIDAGRALCLGLHWERGMAHLAASPIDPREVIGLFPDLQPSPAAVAAVLRGQAAATDDDEGAGALRPGHTPQALARAYRFPSRFLTSSLTQGVAAGIKRPADAAAGEGADGASSAVPYAGLGDSEVPGAVESLRLAVLSSAGPEGVSAALNAAAASYGGSASGMGSSSMSSGAGVNPLRTGIADVGSLTHAGLTGYLARLREETAAARGGAASGGSGGRLPPRKQAQAVAERMAAAYEAVTRFLRQRRAVLLEAARLRRREEAALRARGVGAGGGRGGRAAAPAMHLELDGGDEDFDSAYEGDSDDGGEGGSAAAANAAGGGPSASDYGYGGGDFFGDDPSGSSAYGYLDYTGEGDGGEGASARAITVAKRVGRRRVWWARGSSYNPRLLLRGGTVAGGIAVPPLSAGELEAVRVAVDTALARALVGGERWRQLDALLADPRCAVMQGDADALLRSRGRFHSLGLLCRARGMSRPALTLWREMGAGTLSERRLASEEEEGRWWGNSRRRGRGGARKAPALFAASIVGASAGGGGKDGGGGDSPDGPNDADGDDDGPGDNDEDDDSGDSEGEGGARMRGSHPVYDTLSDYEEDPVDGLLVLTRTAALRESRRRQRAQAQRGGAARRRRAPVPAVLGMSPFAPQAARRERARAAGQAARGITDGAALLSGSSASSSASASSALVIDDRYDGLGETVAFLRAEAAHAPGEGPAGAARAADLAWEFAQWALLRAPGRALAIFTSPPPGRSIAIGPASASSSSSSSSSGVLPQHSADAVIAYLSSPPFAEAARRNPGGGLTAPAGTAAASSGSSSSGGGGSPLRLYLEHVVLTLACAWGPYHTRLAREYAAAVVSLRGDPAVVAAAMGGAGAASTSGARGGPKAPPLSLDPVEADRLLGGPARDRPAPGGEGGALGVLRARLLCLLQESPHLDAGALLGWAPLGGPGSSLWEERAVLHGRRGQHAPALGLLVFDLADHDAAVRYCCLAAHAAQGGHTPRAQAQAQGGLPSSSSSPPDNASASGGDGGTDSDPFLLLLRLYLEADAAERRRAAATAAAVAARVASGSGRPLSTALSSGGGGGTSVYLSRALDVLTRHAGLIEPLALARLLPPDLPLAATLPFWAAVLPSSTHASREAGLAKALWNHVYIDAHARLVGAQAVPTLLTRGTSCAVCEGRLMGDTVFALLPGPPPAPVHFHCLRRGQQGETAGANGAGSPANRPGGAAATAIEDGSYGARLLGLGATPAAASASSLLAVPAVLSSASSLLASTAAAGSLAHACALASAHGVLDLFPVRPLVLRQLAPTSASAGIAGGPPLAHSFAASKGWVARDGSPAALPAAGSPPPDAGAVLSLVGLSGGGGLVQAAGSSPFEPLPLLDVSSLLRTSTVVPSGAGGGGGGKGGAASSASRSAAAAAGNPFGGEGGDAPAAGGADDDGIAYEPPSSRTGGGGGASKLGPSGGPSVIKITRDELAAASASSAGAGSGKAGPSGSSSASSSSSGNAGLTSPGSSVATPSTGAATGGGAPGGAADGGGAPSQGKLDLSGVVMDDAYFAYTPGSDDEGDGAGGGEAHYPEYSYSSSGGKRGSPAKGKGGKGAGGGGGDSGAAGGSGGLTGPAARYALPARRGSQ